MSDLLRGVLEITAALLESATLGSETARCQGLLFLGHGLAFPFATPFAALPTGSKLGMGSRLAFVGLATRIVHASGAISDGLAVVLLVMVTVAAQRAHASGVLMIC